MIKTMKIENINKKQNRQPSSIHKWLVIKWVVLMISSQLGTFHPCPTQMSVGSIIRTESIYLSRKEFNFPKITCMVTVVVPFLEVNNTDCMLLLIVLFGEIILLFFFLKFLVNRATLKRSKTSFILLWHLFSLPLFLRGCGLFYSGRDGMGILMFLIFIV